MAMINVNGQRQLDSVFPHSYVVDTDVEFPPTAAAPEGSTGDLEWPSPPPTSRMPSAPVWYYGNDRVSQDGGRDGVLLWVRPAAAPPWLGVFAPGLGPSDMRAMCTTPDPDRLLVVNGGAAYLVHAEKPRAGFELGDYIHIALQLPEHGILLLGTTDVLIAYRSGPSILWESEPLVVDELVVTAVQDGRVHVNGYLAAAGGCALDVETGRIVQGRPLFG